MTNTTSTVSSGFDYYVPAEWYGDHADDYDTEAINAGVLAAINDQLPPGVTLHTNGDLIATLEALDAARDLDLAAIRDEDVDLDTIAQRHEHPCKVI